VRVQVNPQALAMRQIGIDDVANAVMNSNVNLPRELFGEPTGRLPCKPPVN